MLRVTIRSLMRLDKEFIFTMFEHINISEILQIDKDQCILAQS